MEKQYRELFDGVRASDRLRMEVMNMKREENKRIRRVPRAALIAAALAVILAGTALAAELLGHVQIELKDPNETNTSGDGYTGEADLQTIPAESLSEAALERAAEMEDVVGSWEFDSWSEAAEFLGLELQSSPKLEEPPLVKKGGCNAMVLAYSGEEQQHNVPFLIILSTAYQADGCRITQTAHMQFQYPGYPQRETGLGFAKHRGETHLEEYTAHSGIQASIVTNTRKTGAADGGIDRTTYTAYWVTDNVLYSLQIRTHGPADYPDSVRAVEILKEILDAYE